MGPSVISSFIVPNGILLPTIEVDKNKNASLQKPPVTPNPLLK
jgi:hypothetical protein